MKKTLLLSFVLLFAMATMAQNRVTIFEESFDGTSAPGWTTSGAGTTNWHISASANAGGSPNELLLYWNPQFNGTARFISPVIDMTGVNSLAVSFKHALDNYTGSHVLGIATTSDGGTTWHEAWQQSYSSSNVYQVTQEIATSDLGSDSFQFCIFYTGNSYNINNWYFDDISLFSLENLDLAVMQTTMPDFTGMGDLPVGVKVINYGVTPITSIEASYQLSGMDPVTQTFSVNLAKLATTTLNFSELIDAGIPGDYDVTININKVNGGNDDISENNMISKTVSVAMTTVQRVPMIEHFSSSTCAPCVNPNVQMHTFCNNNEGLYTYTKYQMNWPSPGDPYYTEEGGTRRLYYGVNAVPMAFMDAASLSFGGVQNQFNNERQVPSYMDIRGSFTVEGNTIHVVADIMPYVNVWANLFVSVNEKETHNNVGSNGETTFHHIFMKMLTSASGDAFMFESGELQQFDFTQNMSGTHVEEMSDLEVSIWVQIEQSQEILNSHFAYGYTAEHPYAVENMALVADAGVVTVTWSAPTEGTPLTYDIYVNGELVQEEYTSTEYSFDDAGEYYVVGVVANYADDKTSVMAAVAETPEAVDMGLMIMGPTEITLDEENPTETISLVNGNYSSLTDIDILSITETENPTGVPYLILTHLETPYTLAVGEEFEIMMEANTPITKGVASTSVTVETSDGTYVLDVAIDGELLSVTEISAETRLYPNPTSNNLVVEGANIAKVEIYNLAGQKVFEQSDSKMMNIDASNWNKGIYLVNVTNTNGAVETMKLVVR